MSWLAFHLYHHTDPRSLLAPAARAVSELAQRGAIDRFFYLHYGLGGPHLRLRLRKTALAGAREVAAVVGAAAADHFSRHPSPRSLPEAEIRRRDRAILAADGTAGRPRVAPDNSLVRSTFRPEMERYGGERLLPLSLDFFHLSSAVCLRQWSAAARADRLGLALRTLAVQAAASADREEEARRLADYPPRARRESCAPILTKADGVWEKRRTEILSSLEEALSVLRRLEDVREPAEEGSREWSRTDPAGWLHLALGSRLLAAGVAELEPPRRLRVLTSHMHMTANRLGLSNPEEVYMSRILLRAFDSGALPGCAAAPSGGTVPAAGALARLADRSLAGLAAPPSGAGPRPRSAPEAPRGERLHA